MIRKTKALWVILPVLMFCLTGCGDSKEARELRLQGITQLNEGKYAEAVSTFDAALEEADGIVNEFELDILRYRGEAELALADYEAAVHTYQILIEVGDGQPEILYCKAAAEAMSGDLETAVADYRTAADVDETISRNVAGAGLALSAIGSGYTKQGEYDVAMGFFEEAISRGQTDAGMLNQMGLCMLEAEQYDEAVSYFEQGLAAADEEQTRDIRYNLIAAYEHKGDFERAEGLLDEYVSAYGSTPELLKEKTFLESR